MPQPPSRPTDALPTWLVVAGSAAILYHFAGIILTILDIPSGPWPQQGGRTIAEPPQFAHASADLATLQRKYLHVAHSFQFDSNRPSEAPGVEFDVHLKDADGTVLKTLRFPDPEANPWVRHRQELLARGLAPDMPVPPPEGEVLAAPGGKVPSQAIWLLENERVDKAGASPALPSGKMPVLHLQTVPMHLIPRTREVWRPSEWALVLVRSYSRHLCRTHGAASAELVRRTRNSVTPSVLFGNKVAPKEPNNPYAMVFEEVVAHCEEVSR